MHQAETVWHSPFGDFELRRLPLRRRESLRAWDAADDYLLADLAASGEIDPAPLVINDAFGALAVPLHSHAPQSWSDSWLAFEATRQNLQRNSLPADAVRFIGSLQTPPAARQVLIKLPKSLALLEDQLLRLKPRLAEDCQLRLAGMQKHMPRRLWTLLETLVGPTETLPGRHKAKLIRVRVDASLPLPQTPYPSRYRLEGTDFELLNHSALFSRERLDIGTRFLLEQMPQTEGPGRIADLGCGNGVIGLVAARDNPEAEVFFVDESFMAVDSARENLKQLDPQLQRFHFIVGNSLTDFEVASLDLVLCNPPFHQQQAVGDRVAAQMFRDAARALQSEGELWVVANRHLNYPRLLKRHFGRVETHAANRKFVILRAAEPRQG